jgi:(p)ppGpp synthase/HD superfamily hydrolase
MSVMLRRPTELEIAERIARYAHATQVDKAGAPYILHVERVVALVTEMGANHATQAVAWLHDVIEDSTWTRWQLIERGRISEPVAEAVEIVSRQEGETYEQFIRRVIASGNVLAIPVKLADLYDHLSPECPMTLRPRYERALLLFDRHPLFTPTGMPLGIVNTEANVDP